MFENNRYLTKAIVSDISIDLQLYLWELVDELKAKIKLDYLQVFQLNTVQENGIILQQIIHSQEIPAYHSETFVHCLEPVNVKIYCIDDGENSTMLLADEY